MNTLRKISIICVTAVSLVGLLVLSGDYTRAAVGLEDTPFGKTEVTETYIVPLTAGAETAERSFGIVMEKFAGYLFMFAGAVAIFYILQAGFTLIRARGDEEAVKKGHQMLIWSVVGFLLVLVSYSLVINVTKIIYGTISGQTP